MKLRQLAVTLVIISATSQIKAYAESTCGKRVSFHQDKKVVDGYPVKDGEYPWHAGIYVVMSGDPKYFCGGTLINSNTILTAAHCLYDNNNRQFIAERVYVHLGEVDRFISGTNLQEFKSHQIIPHPHYKPPNQDNDIGIIRLSSEATLNKFVQPICFWDSDKSISEVSGQLGTVVGWGSTKTGELSNALQQARLPIIPSDKCARVSEHFSNALKSGTVFCAGYTNGTTVCNGDSGGSISIEEKGIYRIIGLVSWGLTRTDAEAGHCDIKIWSVFTDVTKYLTWIKEVVPQLNSPPSPPEGNSLSTDKQKNATWVEN